jgi:hypothetical protein
VLLFFSVAHSQDLSAGEWATDTTPVVPEKPVKPAKAPGKNAINANFGTNMPLMSSAFDTAMWLTAA